jgi:phosphoribosyl 1,2-cyclic phosphodiesterase
VRVCTLASGSSGNAILVESGKTRVLIDAGLSGRDLSDRLRLVRVEPDTITGIVFTHEHLDHVRGAGALGRRLRVPLYFNPETRKNVADLHKCRVEEFQTGEPFAIDGLRVTPFSVSHDAADPVAFVLDDGVHRVGMAADLGFVSRLVAQRLAGASALLLESNHDPHMLETGPYPPDLKHRVAGKRGHLSNGQCGELLGALVHDGLRRVVLIHLSEKNNTPDLALDAARAGLAAAGADALPLDAATQRFPGPMIEL